MSTPNTITNLIPILYEALDVVSRELVGFIPAVARNSSAARASLNETINIPIVPAISGGNITPGQLPVDDGQQTMGNTTMTISKARYFPIRWNGEEERTLQLAGMQGGIIRDQFAQGFRAACNEVEADLAALYVNASRAYGTAGTAPFNTANDFSDFANVRRILEDNGSPTGDLQLVLGSAAMANLRGKQSVLFKANEAGTTDLLRNGVLGQVEGLNIRNSRQVVVKTAGTGTLYTSNTAGYAVGATDITLITGSGTILAGDTVTFAGDANKYVVKTGLAAPGVLVLQEPGLQVALPASAVALTVGAATTPNMAFDRNAIQLITRAPAMPAGGDNAIDSMMIQDPVSGLVFEVVRYAQYRQIKTEICLAWGVKTVVPRHTMQLIGPNS